MRTCRFCRYFSARQEPEHPWDEPVETNEHVVVVPTKGALLAPWFLVIPREHVFSISAADSATRRMLPILLIELLRRLEHVGPLSLFEHGASKEGSAFGCGVNHAHLHVVALPFDLQGAVFQETPTWRWHVSAPPWERAASAEYVTFSTGRNWWRAEPTELPRQFFRRVIANALGNPEAYDYNSNPSPEIAARSLSVIAESRA